MAELSLDFTSLRRAYASGTSPIAVIQMVYARIAAANDPGIFISLVAEATALAQATALGRHDPKKPLWGIPFAIKDNIDLAGLATTASCPEFAYWPQEHAFAVAQLIAAGAIPIGKTNLDQFATGLVGVRTPYGAPRNAFDAGMVPGGSSSGSAIAVARGLVSFALGTDTAGSGRVPAGLNNLVGLKPTLGAISTRGVVPACRTLDCVSVFALTVDDAFEVFSEIARYDSADAYARRFAPGRIGPLTPAPRIAIPSAGGRVFGGDSKSEKAFLAAVEDMRALGADICEIDMAPFFETARLLYQGPWIAERYEAIRAFISTRPETLLDVTRTIIGGAERFSAADCFAALYRLAALKRETQALWRDIDALMVPTYPRPPRVAELAADPIGPNSELGVYTNFVNLLDLCALATPTRFRDDGFPNGVTFLAPAGSDARLASIGAALQTRCAMPLGATGLAFAPPPPRLTVAASGEIELAVVGAHLSGMALNHELTSRGARFLRVGKTTPDYRLFALPGGPPRRPGLLRVADGAGYAIDTEVWALTPETFGSFVASVPAPLGIGVSRLADGTRPKGFIVESEATHAAEDISRWGGWRAYIASLST